MILIVADPADVHAQVVARRLEVRGEDCAILNAADFPTRSEITTCYDGPACDDVIIGPAGSISSSAVKGLWIRRLSAHDISPRIADPTVARFAYTQCRDHFQSLIQAIPNVINPRVAEATAEFKPLQLRAAQMVGLRIPKTIVSNRVEDIREFVAAAKTEVIFKTLSGTAFQFTGTTKFDGSHEAALDAAKLAPTIFQEKIDAGTHIRATMVDDVILSASIRSRKDPAPLDWRLERDSEIRPCKLPDEIENRLRLLRQRLGLRYGAVDLILSTSGEYVFLEINPAGQFLFVEIHGGVPISEAIADALIGKRDAHAVC